MRRRLVHYAMPHGMVRPKVKQAFNSISLPTLFFKYFLKETKMRKRSGYVELNELNTRVIGRRVGIISL